MMQSVRPETHNVGSRWQKSKSATDRLLQQFASQCRLHAEAELQQCIILERDKVLCDMLVHAEFLYNFMEDLTNLQLPPQEQQQTAAENGVQQNGDFHPFSEQHMQQQVICASNPQQQQQQQAWQRSTQQQQQQRQALLPKSYVAHLLRHVTPQQVQHVLEMTAQDWASWMADRFSELVIQLEMWSRTEYACGDDSSSDAAAANLPSSAAPCSAAHPQQAYQQQQQSPPLPPRPPLTPQQQQQQQPCQAGGGRRGMSAPPTLPTAGTAFNNLPGQWPWQQQQQQQPSKWPWQQKALAVSPAHARAVLMHTLEGCVQQNMLGCVLNYVPMIQAEAILTDSGRLGHSGEQGFWDGVTDRLQLSPTQELQLSICMAELQRMDASTDGRDILQRAAEPNLLVAAAQQEKQPHRQTPPPPRPPPQQQQGRQFGQQSQQPSSACPFSARTASAGTFGAGGSSGDDMTMFEDAQQQDPDDGCEQPDIQVLLKQFSDRRYIHLLAAQLFIVNTLSRYQLAVLGVASYPHCPGSFAVANTVARRVKQRQQQWLQGIENSAKATGKVPAGLGTAFWGEMLNGLLVAEPAGGSGCAGAGGAGRQAAAVPYSQRMLQQHEQERAAQLKLHQRYCWSQLGVDLPADDAQQQRQQPQRAQQQQQQV